MLRVDRSPNQQYSGRMGTHAADDLGPEQAGVRRQPKAAWPQTTRAADASRSREANTSLGPKRKPRADRKVGRPPDFGERVEELSRSLATSVPATGTLDPELRIALLRLACDIARLLGMREAG